MPELPDVTIYVEALQRVAAGQRLERTRLASPFVLRTVDPPLTETHGKSVREVRRLGKRIVFRLEGDLFLLVHLMIAGRFHWKQAGAKIPGKVGLAAFDFPHATLLLTEAGTKKHASLHMVRGEEGLEPFDPGGVEPLEADFRSFQEALTREAHTLKRALTDPRLFSGIGNAYSDEILHRARLSPVKLTSKLNEDETAHLYEATRTVLAEWIERLRAETGNGFPEKVTAFHEGMAVHGRYGQPCPVCGSPVQRIVHAENESNYCATCQTEGRLLADRALSRLFRSDWPKTLEELEKLRQR
ncbi:MAG: formamidopyrimidine-DNA glycosylase [Nitrospirae bacterium]|nr:formamidopyrimidine-DNA glycosylase [Nitrospirota bacterium]